jgi:hypothetical protein
MVPTPLTDISLKPVSGQLPSSRPTGILAPLLVTRWALTRKAKNY